jgi:hypothetical protein
VFCTDLRTNSDFCLIKLYEIGFYNRSGVFTARYALSPCIKQIRFVFKGLRSPLIVPYRLRSSQEWSLLLRQSGSRWISYWCYQQNVTVTPFVRRLNQIHLRHPGPEALFPKLCECNSPQYILPCTCTHARTPCGSEDRNKSAAWICVFGRAPVQWRAAPKLSPRTWSLI